PMTSRAVDVVALLSAIQIHFRNRHRNRIDIIRIERRGRRAHILWAVRGHLARDLCTRTSRFLSGVEFTLLPEIAARHCPFNQWPRSGSVFIERVLAISDRLRLILHVSSATSEQSQEDCAQYDDEPGLDRGFAAAHCGKASPFQIGRASCRERVWSLGGGRLFEKKE